MNGDEAFDVLIVVLAIVMVAGMIGSWGVALTGGAEEYESLSSTDVYLTQKFDTEDLTSDEVVQYEELSDEQKLAFRQGQDGEPVAELSSIQQPISLDGEYYVTEERLDGSARLLNAFYTVTLLMGGLLAGAVVVGSFLFAVIKLSLKVPVDSLFENVGWKRASVGMGLVLLLALLVVVPPQPVAHTSTTPVADSSVGDGEVVEASEMNSLMRQSVAANIESVEPRSKTNLEYKLVGHVPGPNLRNYDYIATDGEIYAISLEYNISYVIIYLFELLFVGSLPVIIFRVFQIEED